MIEKVSPLTVIKDSAALFWERKWAYLGLFSVPVIMATFMTMRNLQARNEVVAEGDPFFAFADFGLALFLFLAMIVWLMLCSHYIITHVRGNARFLPERLPGKIGRMLFFFLKILLLVLVIGSPLIMGFFLVLDMLGDSSGGAYVLYAVSVPVVIVMIAFSMRMFFALPGISVGEIYKIREALRLTRGHTVSIFMVSVFFMLPSTISQFLLESSSEAVTISAGLVVTQSVVNLITQLASTIITCVWYDKLLPGYRQMIKAEGLVEVVGDEAGGLS